MFTWLQMKILVRCGSNPGARRTSNLTPASRKIFRKKTRWGQSFFRGSTKIPRITSSVQTTAKCTPLTAHSSTERTVRYAFFMRSSCDHIQRAFQNFERPALERQDLAVDHRVHRPIEVEFNALARGTRRQRML